MKIAFVELVGFRGFKNLTRFEFPLGFVVLTGLNGAGKSTAMDAIDFVLTGSINKYSVREAKGGGLEEHYWWVGEGQPDDQYVKVGFVGAKGDIFELTRSRERGLETPLDMISRHLCIGDPFGSDWPTTLVQTTLIRDETIAALSLDLPERARFTAVRSAIGGLRGPDHSARTKVILEIATSAKEEQERKAAAVEMELGRALGAVTEARSIAERHSDISNAENTIRSLAAEALSSSNRQEALRKLVAERKRSIPELQEALLKSERLAEERKFFNSDLATTELAAAKSELDSARTHHERMQASLVEAETNLTTEQNNDDLAGHLLSLLEHGEAVGLQSGHCPLCDAGRTPTEFGAAINATRARLLARKGTAVRARDLYQQAKLSANKSAINLANAEGKLAEIEKRRRGILQAAQEIVDSYASWGLSAPPEDIPSARTQLLQRQEETSRLEQALFVLETSSAHDRVTSLQARVENLRKQLDLEHAKLSAAERAVSSAKQIVNARQTVANQVLTEQFDTVLPLLKELYVRLRPHTDWQDIEMDFGGQVRASLNFTVGDGRNPQFLFSSGQRRAAGLAFLLSIHLSRPWCGLQSLLLDDPIQHIDDYRALNLVEVLSAIRRTGRQVIVAVEDPALADILCRRLRSTPLEAGRRFELCTTSNGSAGIRTVTDIFALRESAMEIGAAS